ncbi:MAG: hypothetical protein IPK13_08760 [Deltaproteobacteria bacterium]|nr:hypothetical protein [Deltaproteobacteria bacterium]
MPVSFSPNVYSPYAAPSSTSTQRAPRTLDDLAKASTSELRQLFDRADCPPSEVAKMSGPLDGRQLAWTDTSGRGPLAVVRRGLTRLSPWRGKSFHPAAPGATHGNGINNIIPIGRAFTFQYSIGPSALDRRPCVILNYNHDDNSNGPIRHVHDELRPVGNGLYLGIAMVKTESKDPDPVLYFALALPSC